MLSTEPCDLFDLVGIPFLQRYLVISSLGVDV